MPTAPAVDLLVPRPRGAEPVGLTPAHAHDLASVRAWARSRGYPVDESGTLPLAVLRTYRQVHRL